MTNSTKREESWLFMFLLTVVGGFCNAYTFFIWGGLFSTFQTGNLCRLALAALDGDFSKSLAALLGVLGGLLGGAIAVFFQKALQKRGMRFWQILSLLVEAVAFVIVGFLPVSAPAAWVVFFVSMISIFQLSCFRKLHGKVHNPTIMTGNLRTLGSELGEWIWKHTIKDAKEFISYLGIFLGFPLGVFVGGYLSRDLMGVTAIWVSSVILIALAISLVLDKEEA